MRPTWMLWALVVLSLLHLWGKAGLPLPDLPVKVPEGLRGVLPALGDGLSWGLVGYTTAAAVALLLSSFLQRRRNRILSQDAVVLRFEAAREGKEPPAAFAEFLEALYPALYVDHPFLGLGHHLAVDMLSTEEKVEFVLWMPTLPRRDFLSEIQSALTAHYPGARVERCTDPLEAVRKFRGGTLIRERWRTCGDAAYPLRTFDTFKGDPLNGRLRAARVPPGGGVRLLGMRLLLRAVPAGWEERRIARTERRLAALPVGRPRSTHRGHRSDPVRRSRLEAVERRRGKEYGYGLFEVALETYALGEAHSAGRLLWNLDRSILADTTFRRPGVFQGLRRIRHRASPISRQGKHLEEFLRREMPVRLPDLLPGIASGRQSSLLTPPEIATVLHLPAPSQNIMPRLHRQKARLLPAPAAAYIAPDEEGGRAAWGVGEEEYGTGGRVGPGTKDRTMGTYMAGPTGAGKSTVLQNVVLQDIAAGRGTATLDMKGGLNEEIIRRLCPEDEARVVIFDPARSRRYIGLNPFDRALVEAMGVENLTSHLMGFLKKLVGANWAAATRVRSLLGSAIPLILELEPEPTLLHLYAFFLPESDYRQELVGRCEDPILKTFWGGEFDERTFSDSIAAVQTRLREFLRNGLVRAILCQRRSTLSVPALMQERGIFLGRLTTDIHGVGEEVQGLLGALLLGQFLGAALSRTGREEAENFYGVVLDEFQSVVETGAKDIQELFAKARAGGLMLVAAHQSPEQLDEKTLHIILDNVPNLILFQQAGPAARFFASTLRAFEVEDVLNLPPYRAYARFKVAGQSTGVFSLTTFPLPEAPKDLPAAETGFSRPEEDELDRLVNEIPRLPMGERVSRLLSLSAEEFRAYRERRRKHDLAERAFLLAHPGVDLTPLYPWTNDRKIARVYYLSDLAWGTPPEEVEVEVRRFLRERGLMGARREPARVIPFPARQTTAKEAGR